MNIERQYLAALELTHQMLATAIAQDWDTLTRIEKQRAGIIEDVVRTKAALSPSEKASIARIITEMERESADIVERVQSWQNDAKILLRLKEPVS